MSEQIQEIPVGGCMIVWQSTHGNGESYIGVKRENEN